VLLGEGTRPPLGATVRGTRDGRIRRTADLLRDVQKVGVPQRAVASFRPSRADFREA
jgi:hypothetical protein